MPRKRKDQSKAWLPSRVYEQNGKYVYQPKAGGKITLCSIADGKLACLKQHEQAIAKHLERNLFKSLVRAFLTSEQFRELSPRTQKDYLSYSEIIIKAFGKMSPNDIKPHHVRLFMDKLASSKGKAGKPANATANRHKACLQKICSWAYQRGKIKTNPCIGVEKLKERARTRYISDNEYAAIYEKAPASCQAAMELSYLCMARIGDVVNLKRSDLLNEGILINQGKTGATQIKLWSGRLRAAVDMAISLKCKAGMSTMFLFNKPDGSRYSVRAIQAQYSKAMKSAGINDATFHDIKAKGISDFNGTLAEKSEAAGHTNLLITKSYDRKIKHVRSVK